MATLKQKVGTAAVERTVVANYNDNNVVHKSGNEGIVGTKTFTNSPLVPDVADASDASMKVANTAFVKTVVAAAITSAFDAIYPVGSYAFGVKPTIGTWEEVEGDRALWLKNDADDGTTIAQQLPNITGDVAVNYVSSDGYGALGGAAGSATTGHGAIRVDSTANGDAGRRWPSGIAATGDSRKYPTFRFNASNSNSVYQDNANVQPNAYVMKVYKRTA